MNKNEQWQVRKRAEFLSKCKDPFFFIKQMWAKELQPCKPEHKLDLKTTSPSNWKAGWFGDFHGGGWVWHDFEPKKHITWQQGAILEAIKRSEANPEEFMGSLAIASGHGIGKSCVLAWMVVHYLFSHYKAQVACTAPTGPQMHDILWKEIAKWLYEMPKAYRDLFDWSNGYIRMRVSPEDWFASAKTARKENPEALAGVHGNYVMYVVDEASGVMEETYKTAEGAMTGKNIRFIMTSNPTRRDGYFFQSHGSDDFTSFTFSSEESPVVERGYCDRMRKKYGEESDNYRIRVLGLFPKEDVIDQQGYVSLISREDLTQAFTDETAIAPTRMGVDPSGEGKDKTAWVGRDNFKAKILGYEQTSTPKSVASHTSSLMLYGEIPAEKVTVDNFGAGANVAQELAIDGKMVRAINVGGKSEDPDYVNIRAEAAWMLRQWIKRGGRLVRDERWDELLNIRYMRQGSKIKLMPKKDMRKLGIPSPNFFDALLLTFCQKEDVTPKETLQGQSYIPSQEDPTDPYN